MTTIKPILVTGSHRSGSTWVGKTISYHPAIGYIHEPFNPDYYPHQAGIFTERFDYWFTYISEENDNICLTELKNSLNFSYSLPKAVQELLWSKMNYDWGEPLRILRDYLFFLRYKSLRVRPLVKDPIALFSTEWMAAKFNMDVIILIRHPAAFAGSLKVANWEFPFSDFLEQPLLMRDLLYPFKAEIKNFADNQHDIIDQACLLWKIIHHTIFKYQKKHKDWLFIRHEDLSQDTIAGFQRVFEYLNLDYSESIRQKIKQYTFAEKEHSQRANRVMNSRSNIKSWQNRLTVSEVKRIRNQVEDISSKFYSDLDWE